MNENIIHILSFVALFIAMVLHEISHGVAALMLGDDTAKKAKRLSLNPFRHIDLYMTILLPLCLSLSGSKFLIGGAKPVPINPFNFKKPIQGMAITAICGPLTNIVLSVISFFAYKTMVLYGIESQISNSIYLYMIKFLQFSVVINAVLAAFNLFPILPLDGGRVLLALLPKSIGVYYAKTERFGLIIVILLVCAGFFHKYMMPLILWLEEILKNVVH